MIPSTLLTEPDSTSGAENARTPAGRMPYSTRAAGRIPRWLLGGLLVGEFLLVFEHANQFFFFFYDDVMWQKISERSPFDLQFVTQPVNDHFVPAFLTLQRVVPPLFGYRYWGIALVLALLMVLISSLIWLVGKEFGVRDSLLLPVVAFTGLGAVLAQATTWWSAALHALPSTAAVLGVWLCALRYWKGGAWGYGLLAGVLLFLGECFIEKVSIWLILLPLFDLLVIQQGRRLTDRVVALRRHGLLYGSLLLATAGYVLWWYLSTPFPARVPLSLSRYSQFAWWGWFAGFWPMVSGIRGRSYNPAALSIGTLVALAVIQIVVILAGAAAWHLSRRGQPVVLWFVLGFALNEVVLASGRGMNIYEGATVERYYTDTVVQLAVALCCVLPAIARVGRNFLSRGRPRIPAAKGIWTRSLAAVTASIALSAVVGDELYVHEVARSPYKITGTLQRRAFAALRDLAAGTRVLDVPTPWDSEATGNTNPSDWRVIARAPRSLVITDYGTGPFAALNPAARFEAVRVPQPAGTPNVCSYPGSPQSFQVGTVLPPATQARPSWVLWADVTDVSKTVPASLTLQVSVNGIDTSGPLHPDMWVPAGMGAPQTLEASPGAPTRLWFWTNPRWSGTVLGARLVLVSGSGACVTRFGYGFVP